MTSLFALLLLCALALCAATGFAPERLRPRLRLLLRLAVALCWIAFGVSLWQIVSRTAVALVAPGSARRPQVVDSALVQAATLLVSLGGPAALITALAAWVLRATRPGQVAASPKPRRLKGLKIGELRAEAKDLEEARRLFEEYARARDLDPALPDVAEELARLPGDCAPPRGRLLLARVGGQGAGCVALRGLPGDAAELRRLFVRPAFRHAGLGRALAEAALGDARRLGYARVRLETVSAMREANALFRALGFQEIPPYRADPAAGALFLEKALG